MWTLPPLCLGVIALSYQFPHRHAGVLLHVFTPPILLGIAWLAAASPLIHSSIRRASAFEGHARAILGAQALQAATANRQRNRIMAPRRYLLASLCYFLPLTACMWMLLATENSMISFLYPVTLMPIFYYTGFGIWGSIVISNAVTGVCRETRGRLNLFHQDNLAGLSFVRQYSDETTVALMSGFLVLPMGAVVLTQGYHTASEGRLTGMIVTLVSGIAVFCWVVSTSLVGLRGRFAISRALAGLRDRARREIAADRERLRRLGVAPLVVAKHREDEEAAALRLRTGFFLGSGGWREILQFNLGVATALVTAILHTWLATGK